MTDLQLLDLTTYAMIILGLGLVGLLVIAAYCAYQIICFFIDVVEVLLSCVLLVVKKGSKQFGRNPRSRSGTPE